MHKKDRQTIESLEKDTCTDAQMDIAKNTQKVWTDGQVDRYTNDRGTDLQMDRWTDEQMNR